MINSYIYDTIMQRLAGRTSTSLRAIIVAEVEQNKRELEIGPIKPHFLEKDFSGTFLTGERTYTLPEDFVEEYEEGSLRIQIPDGSWVDPRKVNIEDLEYETDGEDPAQPEGYALFGDNVLYLGPVPDQDYTFKLKYYGYSDPIPDDANTTDNPWPLRFFDYFILSSAYKVALTHLQGQDIAGKLHPLLAIATERFHRAVESRKHVNMDYLLGNSEN